MWVNLRIRIRAAVFVWHWASAYSPGPVTILEQTQSLTHYGVQGRVLIANPRWATVHGLIKGTRLAFRCTSLPADATAIIRNTRLVLPILPILHINIMITMSNPAETYLRGLRRYESPELCAKRCRSEGYTGFSIDRLTYAPALGLQVRKRWMQ